MKIIMKQLILDCILMLMPLSVVMAGDDFIRMIKKEFVVDPDAQLVINNKFGNVHCNNWEKNTIQIEVIITVNASNEEAANKVMDRISVVFTNTHSMVEAKTLLEEDRKPQNSRFQINYIVNIPLTVNIDVNNKFGDIFINESLGKCKITLGYGNLDAKKLGNSDNILDIKFGKGDVNWMKGAILTLKYSTFNIDYAGSMRLNSKFSNFKANKVVALNVTFEGGSLDMTSTSSLDCTSKFSDLDVLKLDQSLNLDIQYGSCDIHEVAPDFTAITIRNKYGDVKVELGKTIAYSLDAQLKFCELDFPEDNGIFTFRSISSTERIYKGTINAKEEKTGPKVSVISEFGNVSLK